MRICPQCKLKYTNDQEKCFVDGEPLEEVPDPNIGTTVAGRYLIEDILGEGGMATVYRARHTLVDKPVAVKIMHPEMAKDENLRERFRREAKNAAALEHPNIIAVHDDGETEAGGLFLVMEILEGSPLSAHIERGAMDPGHVARFGLQIARGLARAHDFGVLHRDLKPDNIFVARGPAGGAPTLKILDFGIARSMHDERLTKAGEIFGTPQYMAPERVTSIDAGPSADLYALGVILFEMLTGKLPFESEEATGFLIKHMQEAPPRPSDLNPRCPRRLEQLVLSLLAKRPEERPVDAHQVIKELTALAPDDAKVEAPLPVRRVQPVAPPTLPPTTLERWGRRTAIFEQMLTRAYPSADAPASLVTTFEEIRATITRVHELRHRGLKEQRKLEGLEGGARELRLRLGFAVQSLAEDLSQAREAARSAGAESSPYLESEDKARAGYGRAHDRVISLGGYKEMVEPDAEMTRAIRELADAMERWQLAHDAGKEAHRRAGSKDGEVEDLEFQVKMLRQNLEKSEASFASERVEGETALVRGAAEIEDLEKKLLDLATRFCEALRPRSELGDLFNRLEREGAG